MNLREAGGAALICNQSRFRLPHAEACTPRNVAALLGIALAQTCLRSHHEQCRGLIKPHGCQRPASTRRSMTTCLNRSLLHLRTNPIGSQATMEFSSVRWWPPFRGHVSDRSGRFLSDSSGLLAVGVWGGSRVLKGTVNHLFDRADPLGQVLVGRGLHLASLEILVGNVQRC